MNINVYREDEILTVYVSRDESPSSRHMFWDEQPLLHIRIRTVQALRDLPGHPIVVFRGPLTILVTCCDIQNAADNQAAIPGLIQGLLDAER